jgi:hypothetical protein
MIAEPASLTEIVSQQLHRPLPDVVSTFAERLRNRHGDEVVAVLAYGSCLRDVALDDSLIDFYVLTDTTAAITSNPLSGWLCRLVPPNVYYDEQAINGVTYRAKYAALTLADFRRKVVAQTTNPYFWARFSQPVALAWCRDAPAEAAVAECIRTAILTMIKAISIRPSKSRQASALWVEGLQLTYGSELRSEGPSRAQQIVDANADYYSAITAAARNEDPSPEISPRPDWRRIQRQGKVLSVLRLLKASFTFRGGADYLAWKISRHSGEKIELTDWQRRHPIFAALFLLPRLLKSGAVK